MKNLLLVFALVSLFSCKKINIENECNCGEIIEMNHRTLTPNSNNKINSIDVSFNYRIKVKNYETENIKTFKTDKTSYYEGEEFCSKKQW